MIETEHTRPHLDKILMGMLGTEDLITKWWNGPNRNWHGQTPAQVYETDPESVVAYIYSCAYGEG
jgi:hypothetical protein